ncbi:MAG: hypothetical protein IJ706_05590 [Clostridia bacterium]|nr:hypothetical protein [Clostridia bacterium]
MKSNVVKYKRDPYTISNLAYDRRDCGDYVGALSILHHAAKIDDDFDIYAQIADTYTSMRLFEVAIYYWFKYLNKAKPKYYYDGYNGLGANFYFVGKDDVAGYYFNKQISCGVTEECLYEDVMEEYLKTVYDRQKEEFKVVYPENVEEKAEQALNDGIELSDSENYLEAIERFSEIGAKTSSYLEAQAEMAFAYFYLHDVDNASKRIKKAIKGGKINSRNLGLAINIAALKDDNAQLARYIDVLEKYEPEGDEKFKKANLLCTLGMFDDAEKCAVLYLEDEPYNANLNYLYAHLLYRKDKFEDAEKYFRYSYIITENPIAKFYMNIARQSFVSGVKENFNVSFELPQFEIERRGEVLKQLFLSEDKKTIEYSEDVEDIARWILSGHSQSMQIAIGVVLSGADDERYREILFDAMINPTLSNEVKHRLLTLIVESDKDMEIGVVYSNVYRRVKITRLDVDGRYRNLFIKAYAFAFGRMSIFMMDKTLGTIAKSAKSFWMKVKDMDDFEAEVPDLACAIYKFSGIDFFQNSGFEYNYFDTKKSRVNKILKLVKEHENG